MAGGWVWLTLTKEYVFLDFNQPENEGIDNSQCVKLPDNGRKTIS